MKPNSNGPMLNKLQKQIIEIYKSEGLKVTCDTNLIETDFLDACFNIKSHKYFPFRKPNDSPQYINTSSNHPPQVIKQIPKTISQRLSKLSCDKSEFQKAIPDYQSALSASGYHEKLEYQEENTQTSSNKKKRKRQIIWYNLPYNKNLDTNLDHKFFQLLDKHFPKGSKFHKIFNRNTIKLSYSCTQNMGTIIKNINRQKLEKVKNQNPQNSATEKLCNCKNKDNCPLAGKCLESSLVYLL